MILRIFLRELKSQKLRMTLTILAIVWGTLSITILLAFGDGLRNQLMISKKGLGDGILLISGGQTEKAYKGLPIGRGIGLRMDVLDYIRQQMPELKAVGGEFITWGQQVSFGSNSFNKKINGVTPEYEYMRSMYPRQGGRFINKLDMDRNRRVVFLGNELADELFGVPGSPACVDPIGKEIFISNVPFTVIGVMQEKQQMGMYSGPDWDAAVMPITTFKTMYTNYRYLNKVVVQLKDVNQSESVKDRLYEELGSKYQFDPTDRRALYIWDVIHGTKVLNNSLIGMEVFFGIIGALTLLVAGVGVANIMYVAVRERTAEIGVKMAMGAKRIHVMTQFILEALMIAGLGGTLGLAVSFGIVKAVNSIPRTSMAMQWLGEPRISMTIALVTISVLAVIGLVSGFFPARKAASVNPVESLRYE